MQCHGNGSILLVALVMMTIILSIVGGFTKQVYTYARYARTEHNLEQAKLLALGGVTISLSSMDEKNLLQNLNRWQTFKLTKPIDGIDGTIKVCVTCEEGKLNLNQAFDFATNEFKKAYRALIPEQLNFKIPETNEKNETRISQVLTTFLKKRKRPLDDISELTELGPFQLWYCPPEPVKKGQEPSIRPIGLYDFFTVWSSSTGINPLLFSDGICRVLGLRAPRADDTTSRKEIFDHVATLLPPIAPTTKKKEEEKSPSTAATSKEAKTPTTAAAKTITWDDASLNKVAALYQESNRLTDKPGAPILATLKKLTEILAAEIEPKTFSVLSYGQVAGIEQGILVVVRKIEPATTAATPDERVGTQHTRTKEVNFLVPPHFNVIRFFWM